jgi:hypothetical protein
MVYNILYNILFFISFNYCFSLHFSQKKLNNKINENKNKICIISSKNKTSFCENNTNFYLKENDLLNKNLITISPGGFKGFYLLGILSYLKQNYVIDDFIYSGASAGAWNSLFMCYKGDTMTFVYDLLDQNIKKAKNLKELQFLLKYKLLSKYKDSDFDLKKLFIGVTTFKYFYPRINIYSDFENLEDAINCCIASSHIPFITGGITNRYKNLFSLDGGFSRYPYLSKDNILHVKPCMWDEIKQEEKNPIKKVFLLFKTYSEFFTLSKNDFIELFDNGFQDAKNHRDYFDTLFTKIDDEYAPEF